MDNIDNFINKLEKLEEDESSFLEKIKNVKMLISSLKELSGMIEMESVKKSIVQQIKFLLINQSKDERKYEGHMLNTVIYGPPGVGKTKVGTILAKIWHSLGLTDSKTNAIESFKNAVNEEEKKNLRNRLKRTYDVAFKQDDVIIELKNSYLEQKPSFDEEDEDTEEAYQSIKEWKTNIERINLLKLMNSDIRRETSINLNGRTFSSSSKFSKKDESLITIVSRDDFVAEYVGQTGPKTLKLLRDNLGKVLLIDEAYGLYNGDKDSFGMDAITTLNRFMSEHPDEIVIIFCGYKELLQQTIFKAQPGLQRRCTWSFEIEGYSGKGLCKIFEKQLAENGWEVDDTVKLLDFFEKNKKEFKAYGGDTERFSFYCKMAYSTLTFEDVCNEKHTGNKVITQKMIDLAIKEFKENNVMKEEKVSSPPPMMYN